MQQKNTKRPKTTNQSLLKPLKIVSLNNSELLLEKEIDDYYKKILNSNLITKKIINKNIDSSSKILNKSQPVFSNISTKINKENKENNSMLNNINNLKKNNSYSQFRNSFILKGSKTSKNKKKIKRPNEIKLISLNKNKKIFNGEIKISKKDLLFAVYKKNPIPLLESIFRATNPDKTLFEEKLRTYFNNKNDKRKWMELILKKKEKNNKNDSENNYKNKFLTSNYYNKKSNIISLFNINNLNNQSDIFMNNKNKIENCMAINTNFSNPLLQHLNHKDYGPKKSLYRSKTENVDDILNINYDLKANDNSWLNLLQMNKKEQTDIEEEKSIKSIYKYDIKKNYFKLIKKKKLSEAFNDTSLDKELLDDKNMNSINDYNIAPIKFNRIKATNIKLNLLDNNKSINNDHHYSKKVYIPKTKLYKKNKYFNKFIGINKKEEKKCNLNTIGKSDVKNYNFNDVINLFDKKISLGNNTKVRIFDNFRNRNIKYYSSSNNVKISLIRNENCKKKKNIVLYKQRPITKDSNMDFMEEIETSIIKNF